MLVLDFSNKFRKSQIFVKLRFVLNLKWFNQDAFMDSATSHFRPQFWSWSCGCGQQELESHWYQLSWSCRRQACAQRKQERRKLAEQSSDALRDSPTTSNGAESNQKYPLPPLYQMEVRWTISFKVMCTANSISDFLKLATAGIRWGPSCMVKLYEHFLVTRLGVVRSHPSSWKCNTLCRNTKSPYGFKGGGIFYKCLSSEIRGGIRISVLAWRKSVTSKWQKNNFKSESLKPAHQKTKQNKLLFFFFSNQASFITVWVICLGKAATLFTHEYAAPEFSCSLPAEDISLGQTHDRAGAEDAGIRIPGYWRRWVSRSCCSQLCEGSPRRGGALSPASCRNTNVGDWFSSLTCESLLDFTMP